MALFHFFILFNGWVVFHCIYVPYLLYPFLCLWTFRLLPCLGYYKHHCNEHWGACIFSNYAFLSIFAQEWDCWIICLFASLEANRHWELQLLGANEALDFVEAPVERIGMGLSSPRAVETPGDQHARAMVWGGGHSPSWEKLVIQIKGRLFCGCSQGTGNLSASEFLTWGLSPFHLLSPGGLIQLYAL